MKAIWNGQVIAESEDTVVVEGNHYFPADSLNMQFFTPSSHTSACPWKGTASYHSVVVDDQENPDAAWYYENPSAAAAEIKDRVAFWRGISVIPQAGKVADLMVVRGDPAARIGDIRNVEIVFKAGLRHSNQASAASPARADGRSSDR